VGEGVSDPTTKRGPGRPTSTDPMRLRGVRWSDAQHEAITRRAEQAELGMAEFVRRQALWAAIYEGERR